MNNFSAAKLTQVETRFINKLLLELGLSGQGSVTEVNGDLYDQDLRPFEPRLVDVKIPDNGYRPIVSLRLGKERKVSLLLPPLADAKNPEAIKGRLQQAIDNIKKAGSCRPAANKKSSAEQADEKDLPSITEFYPPYSAKREQLIAKICQRFAGREFTRHELNTFIRQQVGKRVNRLSLITFFQSLKRNGVICHERPYSRRYRICKGGEHVSALLQQQAQNVGESKSASYSLSELLEKHRLLKKQIAQAEKELRQLEQQIKKVSEEELGTDGLVLLNRLFRGWSK